MLIEAYEEFEGGEDRLSSVGGVGKVATDEATGFS